MSNELYRMNATEAAREIAAGRLSATDLLEACLDRVAAMIDKAVIDVSEAPPRSVKGAARDDYPIPS